ncbi:hypothetical protein N7468_001343 [Penicillium chermesinum]|uniref:Zn(2)-C6 fungal-type domain-containing protein n=1 Tax=Penicillium chermesinum TaxID=63820 RepID=A0A9W9PGM1_9EURO|nr:uncharacterized protein N7468_001343 [Penicillium chermesinum]KAJ5246360.1 hypothetical protein N7468_001343 [Penicillium chermesinum]
MVRVKCDEQKPACNKCTSTGRKCDYPAPQTPGPGPERDLDVQRSLGISPAKQFRQVPQLDILTNEAESRALEFFQLHTAHVFGEGIAPYVLQATVYEPVIRTIAISLGSLHRSFILNQGSLSTSDDEARFILRHYTKAIGQLLSLDLHGSATSDTFLIACVLFFCFECLQSNYKAAFQHATSGLKIIKNHVETARQSSSTYMPPETLALLFTVLENQILEIKDDELLSSGVTILGWSPFPDPIDELGAPSLDIDGIMRSFQILYNDLIGFEAICDRMQLGYAKPPEEELPEHLLSEYYRLAAGLHTWMSVFDDWLQRGGALNHEKHPTVLTLRIWRLAVKIVLELNRPMTELIWDKHMADFDTITLLAAEMLGHPLSNPNPCSPSVSPEELQKASSLPVLRPKPPKSISSVFSLSLGINTPLYIAATRCRDSVIRHRAIELLLFGRRREGLWDYYVAGRIAKHLVAIEESSAGIPDGTPYIPSDIPLADRVRSLSVQFEKEKVVKVQYQHPKGVFTFEENFL